MKSSAPVTKCKMQHSKINAEYITQFYKQTCVQSGAFRELSGGQESPGNRRLKCRVPGAALRHGNVQLQMF